MRVVLYGILFLLPLFAPGQSSTPVLERLKDYINAELTYTILANQAAQNREERVSMGKIEASIKINTVKAPIPYATIKTWLQGSFEMVDQEFAAVVNGIDTEKFASLPLSKAAELLNDEAFLILRKNYASLVPVYKRDLLYQEISKQLPEENGLNVQYREKAPAERKGRELSPILFTNSKGVSSLELSHFTGSDLLIWIFMGCIFIYCFVQFHFLKSELKATKEELRKAQQAGEEQPAQGTHPMAGVYSEFRLLVTGKLTEMLERVEAVQKKMADLERGKEALLIPMQTGRTGTEDRAGGQVFYMTAPATHYFPLHAQTASKERALYQFTVAEDKTVALYEVINDGLPISEAVNKADRYLDAACEAKNQPKWDSNKVVTKFPGIAFLEGDKWIIKHKATVVFK